MGVSPSRTETHGLIPCLFLAFATCAGACDRRLAETPDAAADSGSPIDGGSWHDGGFVDSGHDVDAQVDSGEDPPDPCEPCVAQDICHQATCSASDGICHQVPVSDGVLCGEGAEHVCVFGACVLRGCGDGYREPGPFPEREGCDDANAFDGDLCSSACDARVDVVDAHDDGDYDAYAPRPGPVVGFDGEGRALVIWLQDHFLGESLVARRFDRFGGMRGELSEGDAGAVAFQPELLVLDDTLGAPSNASPVVAGLAGGGWVVAWTASRVATRDVVYRLISPDGAIGPERVANQQRLDTQEGPQAIGWGSGFVLGWSSRYDGASDPQGGVAVRAFGADGLALGGERSPAVALGGKESELRLASSGSSYLALWVQQGEGGDSTPMLRGRRFDSGGEIDAAALVLSEHSSLEPAVTGLGDGGYAFAWRSAETDLGGDVQMRWLSVGSPAALSEVVDVAVTLGLEEERPSLAASPGGEVVVAWEEGFPRRPTFAISEAASPGADELAVLSAYVNVHASSQLVVTSTERGVLFLWEGSSSDHFGGALSAFLLPFD